MGEIRPERLRVGVLVDSPWITQWQLTSMEQCEDLIELVAVVNCTNSTRRRHLFRHFAYYVLSAISLRGRQTKSVPWAPLINDRCEIVDFECQTVGKWQILGDQVRSRIGALNLDVIVRFGMNLIRDAETLPVTHGILSFHHGDPTMYRGRPAGFYEILDDASHVGVIVQELSNKLDAGQIRAIGRYRLERHSYKKTMDHVFSSGTRLLRTALKNCLTDKSIPLETSSKSFQLPSNVIVIRFLFTLLLRKAFRLIQGLFVRRKWEISIADSKQLDIAHSSIVLDELTSFSTPRGLEFIADPFTLADGVIVCEAMPRRRATGRLMTITGDTSSFVDTKGFSQGKHLSFPFVVVHEGTTYILPEMAQSGPQALCELDSMHSIRETVILQGLENDRLIDPVLHFGQGRWWLFAGKAGLEADHLFLWFSDQITGPYEPHPLNPVVTDPASARNAGPILNIGNKYFRTGQNNRRQYGNGVTLNRIVQLDTDTYAEEFVASIRVAKRCGPHTLSLVGERLLIDSYKLQLDLFAWLPRVLERTPWKR